MREGKKMRKKEVVLLFVSLAFFAIICPNRVLAAPYYQGKMIKIIVGGPTGGGYDRVARLLAKHLPKHIPGNPTIIIENMAGASSIIAANYIYNLAKADGMTIGAPQRGIPTAQILKIEGARFDAAKYSWIGSAAVEATVLTIRTDLPYKTFNDLLKAKSPIMFGQTGPTESSSQFLMLLKEFLGLNLKMIMYPHTPEAMLALERKEVDGRAGSYSSMKPFIERGLIRPLIRGKASEAGIEDLPVDEDLAKDSRAKTIMGMRSAGEQIGRPYVTPPRTPENVMKILRDAFAKAINDPELKEDAKKTMTEVKYTPADECLKVIDFLLNQPEDIIKEFSKYMKF